VAPKLAILSSGLTESNPAILILAGADAEPGALIKVPRSGDRRLRPPPEVRKLARLGRLLPGAYPRSTPVPEGVEWPGTAQTFLQGQVLSSHSSSERPEIVYRMASWLFDLHQASTRAVKRGELRPPDRRRFLRSQAAAATRNGLVPAERAGEVRNLFDILARTPLELVMCHRDAGAWNIVAPRGYPYLVDWDSATWGLPGEDLLYLLLYLIFQETGAVEPGDRVEAFRARFVEPSGRPVWLREALLRLSRHVQVEGSCLQALLAVVLLRHANDQHVIAHFAPRKEALAEPFGALLAAVLDAGPDPWSAAVLRGPTS
jgi:aminoglycoside phosphotransferase (APT) family kinase protein